MSTDQTPNQAALEQILARLRAQGFVQSGLVLKQPMTGEVIVLHELEHRKLDSSEIRRLMRGN